MSPRAARGKWRNPAVNAGWCRCVFFICSDCSLWHARQAFTGSGWGNPGVLPPCGLWQASAIAQRARMLHFGFFDLLCLVGMAGNAHAPWRRPASAQPCRPSPAAWQLSHILFSNGLCSERLHQLRLVGLVRIVALKAISVAERLTLMRLDAGSRPSGRGSRGTAPGRFWSGGNRIRACRARRSCASCGRCRSPYRAPHGGCRPSEHSVPCYGRSGKGSSSLVSPVVGFSNWFLLAELCGSWHLMQSRTAGGWTLSVHLGGFLVRVAGQAQRLRSSGDELYARNVFINANLVAGLVQPI